MGARKRIRAEKLKSEKLTTAVAGLKSSPIAPRKMRLVADLVRGVEVNKALNILQHNSKFASFTLIAKSDYQYELNIPIPFSLVSNDVSKDNLLVMPGYWFMYNMYALARNADKYVSRDKRIDKTQEIEYDFLAPDSVNELFVALQMMKQFTGKAYAKKNEVKITVIAAGFPEGVLPGEIPTAQTQGIKPREDLNKGRIFNTVTAPTPAPVVKEKVEEKKDLKNEVQEDDDWGAVPAFLRRSKLK